MKTFMFFSKINLVSESVWPLQQNLYLEMRMSKGLRDQHIQLGPIICGAFFFQDMIKINQIFRLKAWCVYFQDKKLFWPTEISTCLENSSNLKNHKCLAQKWIYHCKFENFTFFKFTMVNAVLSRTFVIFEVGRIF